MKTIGTLGKENVMVNFKSGKWNLWEGPLEEIPENSIIAKAAGIRDQLEPYSGYFSEHSWIRLRNIVRRSESSFSLFYFVDTKENRGSESYSLVVFDHDRYFVFQQWEPYDPSQEPEDDCL